MSKSPAMDLVLQFMGKQNTIPTPVPFIRMLGDHAAAAFLSQCLYWGERTEDAGGWFHKTHEEWQDELVLSPDQVRRCVRTCGALVEVKRKGIPARNYYRANREAVALALADLANGMPEPISRSGETPHQGADKPSDKAQANPTAVCGESPRQVVRGTQDLRTEPTSEPTQNPQQKENTLVAAATARAPQAQDTAEDRPQTSAADLRPVQAPSTATAAPRPATDLEQVPPGGAAPARRLSDAARIIAAWNDHRGTLPEVQDMNEGRKKAIKKLLADCEGDVARAAAVVAEATREVAGDEFWQGRRYGFDTLVPGRVFQRAEAWRSRQGQAGSGPAPTGTPAPILTTGVYRVGQRVSYKREQYSVEVVADTYVDLYDDENGSARVLLASSDWHAIKPLGGQA